jgi:hypothetical protein
MNHGRLSKSLSGMPTTGSWLLRLRCDVRKNTDTKERASLLRTVLREGEQASCALCSSDSACRLK